MKKGAVSFAKILTALVMALFLAGCSPGKTTEGTGGYLDDTVITTKVKAKLFSDSSLKSREINVETFKGKVQLSGFVSSSQMADKAITLTRQVDGVQSVINNMQVK